MQNPCLVVRKLTAILMLPRVIRPYQFFLLILVNALLSAVLTAAEMSQLPGHRATKGAAAGYVADELCAECHDEYDTYQQVAMANSFYRPSVDNIIENFEENHYYHAPSRRHYQMSVKDKEYWFKRYQLDVSGKEINSFEIKVDWIMGSGNHVRTYLYQTPMGELYELPLAWYSQQQKWGMQPGYEAADHSGVLRVIRRECMFCHNAYPEVPVGNDDPNALHIYPETLPEGTGCQRCHGPGEEHIEAYESNEADLSRVRTTIVNPGRLPPQRRDDVCDSCHLSPAVAVTAVRRFGRNDYSFVPGQDLTDYLVNFEITEQGKHPRDRFEINHHAYRLRQSQCFKESGEELHCMSCHDPHRKVAPEHRPAHYRNKCLACHEESDHPATVNGAVPGDCIFCHMPKRRPRDVIEVTMTDHLIQIVPAGEDPAAAIGKEAVAVSGIELLQPVRGPGGDLADIYRVIGLLRPGNNVAPEVLNHLWKLLQRSSIESPTPYYDLIKALLKNKRFKDALKVIAEVEKRAGTTSQTLHWSAVANMAQGDLDMGMDQLHKALQIDSSRPDSHYNLALALNAKSRHEESRQHLELALKLRPNFVPAWYYLGKVTEALKNNTEAASHYRRALAVDPAHTRSYMGIVRTYEALGDTAAADRYLEHGLEHARQPELIRKMGASAKPAE